MGSTLEETNKLIDEAYHDAMRAQRKLDWVLAGAPRTPPYSQARAAAAAAHPSLGIAIDTLRAARRTATLGVPK